MDKIIKLNDTDVFSIIDELYPTNGLMNVTLDPNSLTINNLDNFINRIEELLEHVELVNGDEQSVVNGNQDSRLSELMSDPSLNIFGHGGAAEEILNSGHFYCMYNNLDSHFLSLESSNINLLDKWPHNGADKILILAINKYEVNPIYKELSGNTSYSEFRYEIPIEYFAGYYDVLTKSFVENPLFKRTHQFNPECDSYTFEMTDVALSNSEDINKFYNTLRRIAFIFYNTSNGLSEEGYVELGNQIRHLIGELRNLMLRINSDTDILLNSLDEEVEEVVQDESWINDFDDQSFTL